VDHVDKLLVAALLVFMARGSGRIEQQEADTMIALLSEYCGITGAEALELLQTAINELAEQPAAGASLTERARSLSDERKEDLAYLALRVIAADGKREAAEMAQFNRAVEVAGIDAGIVHRAFDRFFAETMPETGD
jgi:uncharacterized tellurite resistance protein B-like protein